MNKKIIGDTIVNMVNKLRARYLRCPYCGDSLKDSGHTNRQPKGAGHFVVKQLYTNVLIMECQRCKKVCRYKYVGSVLLWADMNPVERKAFNKEQFVTYKNQKEVKK